MNLESVQSLLNAYKNMREACEDLATSLTKAAGPIWLPPGYELTAKEATDIIINDFCKLWRDDKALTTPSSGLICAPDTVIEATRHLNQSKLNFKKAVKHVKQSTGAGAKGRNTLEHLETLAEANRQRHPETAKALKQAGLASLDLNSCYRTIRILPPTLQSISWTWAKHHSEVKKLQLEQALDLTQHISSDTGQWLANDQLAKLKPSEPLAFYKQKRRQLRANICWLDDTEKLRKMVTVSGVLVVNQDQLPAKIKWPKEIDETPSDETKLRQKRQDRTIESEAYIGAIHIHRYKE